MSANQNPYNCSQAKVDAYQGKSEPACRGGRGCEACWAKYNALKKAREQQPQ